MDDIDNTGFCAFHYSNDSDGECSLCHLPICNLDQNYDIEAKRICQLCSNIAQARKKVKYIQIGLYVIVFGLIGVLFLIFRTYNINTFYAFLPIILMVVAPYILRPLIMRFYFKNLAPKESALPILKYFEASGNSEHYKMFLGFIEKLSPEELIDIKNPLFDYLVPALAFNYSRLPENWEEDLIEKLDVSREEFVGYLIGNKRKLLIQTAVHAAQPNMSQFIFYLSETADDKELLKEYITTITSKEILELNDIELNTIYNKLLEDLFLYEDEFYAKCDQLNLLKQKDIISQLLSRYEPPPVPKNQFEAVMTPDQLREKRRQETEGPIELTYVNEEEKPEQ